MAGLLLEKFRSPLPLSRHPPRLAQAGITLSRAPLTQGVHRTADLWEPIDPAFLSSILHSPVLARAETPIKAGRHATGKLHPGSCWPISGEQDEVAFPVAASRAGAVVREAVGSCCGVLGTDGYLVYDRFAQPVNRLVHAPCWRHPRRHFVEAERAAPARVAQALDRLGALSAHEAGSRQRGGEAAAQAAYRAEDGKPMVDAVFVGLQPILSTQPLLPSHPFTHAARYALAREQALKVFLEDPAVPLDTTHREREMRASAWGRRNWVFGWTEVGARYGGIVPSLLTSCRLPGVDPSVSLVEVVQRIETHPAFEVQLLTPRWWKQHCADNPLRSDLDRLRQ